MTILSSPTMSSTSSYDLLSSYDSDDEIVWSVSEASLPSDSDSSEDDFVVLARPKSQASLAPSTPSADRARTPSAAPTAAATKPIKKKAGSKRSRKRNSKPKNTFAARPIVDDISEGGSSADSDGSPSIYEDASDYITSYEIFYLPL